MVAKTAAGVDWQPSADLPTLKARAAMLADIRAFFAARAVLEVETPVLGRHGVTDVHLAGIPAQIEAAGVVAGGTGWLQTSPEYHMKRLLAAGSGSIYQVFRAFRNGERGRRHNPEFSLLEWYRTDFDLAALMDEVADLVVAVAGVARPGAVTYRGLFQRFAGLDPFLAPDAELRQRAAVLAGMDFPEVGRDGWLDIILTHGIEPALRDEPPLFVYQYPASQAALARVDVDEQGAAVAHRFELYVRGLELCNGYWELLDADEQTRRFAEDNRRRQALGLAEMAVDELLLAALEAGMPACAGVALGLDRLLMVKTGKASIDEVLAFPLERA